MPIGTAKARQSPALENLQCIYMRYEHASEQQSIKELLLLITDPVFWEVRGMTIALEYKPKRKISLHFIVSKSQIKHVISNH